MVRKPITQDVDGLGEQGRNFKVWLVTRGGAQGRAASGQVPCQPRLA